MSWSGWATVTDVSDGPAPIDVLMVASTGDSVKPFKDADTEEGRNREVPALTSNTEGKLHSVEIKMVFDEDEPPLAVGDVVSVYGHFNKRT